MRRLSTVAAAMAVAMTFTFPAHAETPVAGTSDYHLVSQKTEAWTNRFLVPVPFSSYLQQFVVTAKLDYYRWFDNGVDKIAPFGFVACWRTTRAQGPPTGGFQSLTTNLGFVDSTVAKGPYKLVVPGEHTLKHCDARYVPVRQRVWMPVKDHPSWVISGTFDYLNGFTHKHVQFHLRWQHSGKTYDIRVVQPSNDPTISRVVIHTNVPNIGGA